jgi:glycosyltransferase involved in cell wall biosynthesis
MRILFLITKSNWGGAQKYVYDLATSLSKEKYQVKVAAGGSGILVDKLKEANIEVIPVGALGRDVSAKKDAATSGQLWKIFRREKPEVLHVNSSKAGGIGALIGRILRVKKIVFTAHGWAFNEDRPWYQKVVIKFLHWTTIVLCHETIAVSQNTKDSFKNWPLVKGKIIVIHNGIKSATGYGKSGARQALVLMFPQLKTALARKDLFWVGTIAELHPVKNLNISLQAMKLALSRIEEKKSVGGNSPYFIYTVMGEGHDRQRLEAMIKELGLSENVFLLGHVPDAFQYIRAFDVFLLPSRSEALAYVILEAGMQETPVIATTVGGIPEIIDDMESGILIQPGKVSEIASAIEYYAEHPDTARAHAAILREKVKRDFSLEKMVRETEEVYGVNILDFTNSIP